MTTTLDDLRRGIYAHAGEELLKKYEMCLERGIPMGQPHWMSGGPPFFERECINLAKMIKQAIENYSRAHLAYEESKK